MPVNRKLWLPPFTKEGIPPWPCPSCEAGSIAVSHESLTLEENPESKAAHEHDAWEPEWIEGVFAATARCVSPLCGQFLALSGSYRVEEGHDVIRHEQHYFEVLEPTVVYPAPPLFPIPAETPQNVEDAVKRAFSLYWPDPTASAAQMRTGIEIALSDRRVPRRRKLPSGKFKWLTLHERIERFKEQDVRVAEYLLAVKWLGNEGAHGVAITREDLLTGFELVDLALDGLYETRRKRIEREARKLIRRRRRGSHGGGA